jgi:hypothetical protein
MDKPNPYLLALLTAVLAGLFSITGGYFTASFQAKNAVLQKQLEYRAQAYTTFLEKIDKTRAPLLAELLNIGSLANNVGSDGEIQELEDRMGALLDKAKPSDIYWQLNSDFNILRLHGTPSVRETCQNLLKVLSFRHWEVNWSTYSPVIQNYYKRWRKIQDKGVVYGWEAKILPDERLMLILTAQLFEVLLGQLRDELRSAAS